MELVPQLMVELLQEAQVVLASVRQEKEQALERKEYDRAAELGNREKKLRDSISKLETFWHLQPRFAQKNYAKSDREIIENDAFDTFTVQLLRVINRSLDEAKRLEHNYIGTEHLLLALVREGQGIAAGVLESWGVNVEKVLPETKKVLHQQIHP